MESNCFLCGRHDEPLVDNIVSLKVSTSQKPVETVLKHLARCIKMELIFHEDASICRVCFYDLCRYDKLMVNLLHEQKRLTSQLSTLLSRRHSKVNDDTVICFEETVDNNVVETENNRVDDCKDIIEVDDGSMDIETMSEYETKSSDDDDEERTYTNKRFIQECMRCNLTFKNKLELQNHMTTVHDVKVHACKICGAVRRDEEYLELHMNVHEGKTEQDCRYCSKRFSRPVNTIRHMRKHWDQKKFQCEKCGERFSLDNMLYNHRLKHEAEENPIICIICNQSFKSRKTFNRHVLIHQENRPRHHCTVCTKSFTERYTLKMHMKTHGESQTNESQATVETQKIEQDETDAAVTTLVGPTAYFQCIICSVKLDNKELLEHHLQFDHDVILK